MHETRRPAEVLADRLAGRGDPTGTDAYRDTLDPGEPLTRSERAAVIAGLFLMENAESNSVGSLERAGYFKAEGISAPSYRQIETLRRRLGRAYVIIPATRVQIERME